MAIYDIENLDRDELIDVSEVVQKSNTSVDVCIINFSYKIMDALIADGLVDIVEDVCIKSVSCDYPLYVVKGTRIGVIKTTVGAPITASLIEEVSHAYSCKKFVLFGTCGGLDKSISPNKIIVPTHACRDEGMSYHYAPPADYIEIKNYKFVAEVLDSLNIDYVLGKTWTTDSFYRETRAKFNKVRSEGCIAVEMEVASCQAVADWRGAEFYAMLFRADNLDSTKWERGIIEKLAIDSRLQQFFVALEVAKRLENKA